MRGVGRFVVASCIGFGWLALGCGAAERVPAGPPNIVVVIGDDQSWRDYGFMGSPVAITPRIDELAHSGTVFTHAYSTASSCRPSLRAILTGLEPQRLWALEEVLEKRGAPFPKVTAMGRVETLPAVLGERGYVSFQGGKHWEGRYSATGFTEGLAVGVDRERARQHGMLGELSGGPSTELGRTTLAPLIDFIEAHRAQPFFVWFAPKLPHVPHDPPEEFVALYEGADLAPEDLGYFGNVSRLDALVGEILDTLERLELRERTLVLFVGDNGWDQIVPGGGPRYLLGGPRGKFTIYENGFRTPLILSWPGHVPADQTLAPLVTTLDIYPTLLDYAGVSGPPPQRNGVSLKGLIQGGDEPERAHLIAGMHRTRPPDESPPGVIAVPDEESFFLRAPGWRYVWRPSRDREELYAIDDDPWETTDLATAHPERVARYRAEVEAWRDRMRKPAPARDRRRPAAAETADGGA